MTKFTDSIRQALERKQNKNMPAKDATSTDLKKATRRPVPVITGRPVKKATGRGG